MLARARSIQGAAAALLFCCSCSTPVPVLPVVETPPAGADHGAGGRGKFDDRVAAVRILVERFWAGYFSTQDQQYALIAGFDAYDAKSPAACGPALLSPRNAAYCSVGDFIAFDREWLLAMFEAAGDDAVYIVISHEFGHAVQARLGSGPAESVRMELQADCYAGAFVADLVRTGKLPESGGAERMFGELAASADRDSGWWLPDSHGTAAERQYAFQAGVVGGVSAC